MRRPALAVAMAVLAPAHWTFGSARAQGLGRSPELVHPSRVVDSVRSVHEDLSRFRAGMRSVPTHLRGGAPSRTTLVRRFVDALARADTAALIRMAVTRAEYAYLVYPASPYTRPPYRQSPEIAWLLLRAEHEKGLTRLTRRLGGQSLTYLGHRCDCEPLGEGSNRIWRGCSVRIRVRDWRVVEGRLFGAIVERDGAFKFASYATDF